MGTRRCRASGTSIYQQRLLNIPDDPSTIKHSHLVLSTSFSVVRSLHLAEVPFPFEDLSTKLSVIWAAHRLVGFFTFFYLQGAPDNGLQLGGPLVGAPCFYF